MPLSAYLFKKLGENIVLGKPITESTADSLIMDLAKADVTNPKNFNDPRVAKIDGLKNTLQELTYSPEEVRNKSIIPKEKELARTIFKAALTDKIKELSLDKEATNKLLKQLDNNDYTSLLDYFEKNPENIIPPRRQQELLSSVKGFIVGAQDTLAELKVMLPAFHLTIKQMFPQPDSKLQPPPKPPRLPGNFPSGGGSKVEPSTSSAPPPKPPRHPGNFPSGGGGKVEPSTSSAPPPKKPPEKEGNLPEGGGAPAPKV